jgi:thioredoxin reductase (NADPH)
MTVVDLGERLKKKKTEFDLVILGGGPAGLTAAIYASRALLSVLILEKMFVGGLQVTTEKLENYPGFSEGIGGGELSTQMEKQAKKFGTEIYFEEVIEVSLKNDIKIVKTTEGEYWCKAIIIATGTVPKKLGIPGEEKFKGKGVSYCATCDGPFFKDKDLVVIGAGSSGVQESLYLTRFAKNISIIEILPTTQCEKILIERASKEPKIKFFLEHQVLSINGENKVESVTIQSKKTNEQKIIPCAGVFFYVGLIPLTDFLKGQVELDQWGYVIADEMGKTSTPGVFVAGDVRVKTFRQVATAVGDGANAAFMVEKYIEQEKS